MMITNYPHNKTQWFFKIIQLVKDGLNKFYINIYTWWLLSISKL